MEQKREAGETEAVTKRQSFATGKYTVAAPDASTQEAAAGSGHEHPPRAGGLRPAVSTRPTANSPWRRRAPGNEASLSSLRTTRRLGSRVLWSPEVPWGASV